MNAFSVDVLLHFVSRLGGAERFNAFIEMLNKIGQKEAAKKIGMKPSQLSRYLKELHFKRPYIPPPEVRQYLDVMLNYEQEQNNVASKREAKILRFRAKGDPEDETGNETG